MGCINGARTPGQAAGIRLADAPGMKAIVCALLTLSLGPSLAAQTASTPAIAPAEQAQAALDSRTSVNSLSAVSSRVKPGDTILVHVTSGEDILGRFSSASSLSLTVLVDGQPREIPAGAVQQVVRQRGANRLVRGLIIGAPLGAYLIGSGLCTRVDTSTYQPGSESPPSCGVSILEGAAIGAGIGAIIGSSRWRPLVVYSARSGPPAAQPPTSANAPTRVETPAPVIAQAPADARAPVTSLGALQSRVTPFEKIYVRKMGGEEIDGHFQSASDVSLAVEVDGKTRQIPAGDVQQVWRRGGTQGKKGMLVGFLFGAAILDVMALTPTSSGGWSTGDRLAFGTLAGGGAGAIWGGIIGLFVHERPLVYRAPARGERDASTSAH
jgi:hypothetical protein